MAAGGYPRADGGGGTYRFVVADVFTDKPLTGNQLAVFTDARELSEDLLQPLAKEIGFSETVFVYPPEGRRARAFVSSRPRASFRSLDIRRSGRHSSSAGRCSSSRSASRRARGLIPVGSSGRAPASRSAG